MNKAKELMSNTQRLASLEVAWNRLVEHHERLLQANAPEDVLLDFIESKCHLHALLEDARERAR